MQSNANLSAKPNSLEAMKQHLTGKGVLYPVNQVPNSASGAGTALTRFA
jgi:hypothetical protein